VVEDRVGAVKVAAVRVAAVRVAGINPAQVPLATVSARVVGTKSRTWPVSVALTEPVLSAG
jgi:hypothetical protein